VFLLSPLAEDPQVQAGARRLAQGSRVIERPRPRGSALNQPSTPAH